MSGWMGDATTFVRRNRDLLASRPVWSAIDAWAAGIADELQRVEAPAPAVR